MASKAAEEFVARRAAGVGRKATLTADVLDEYHAERLKAATGGEPAAFDEIEKARAEPWQTPEGRAMIGVEVDRLRARCCVLEGLLADAAQDDGFRLGQTQGLAEAREQVGHLIDAQTRGLRAVKGEGVGESYHSIRLKCLKDVQELLASRDPAAGVPRDGLQARVNALEAEAARLRYALWRIGEMDMGTGVAIEGDLIEIAREALGGVRTPE